MFIVFYMKKRCLSRGRIATPNDRDPAIKLNIDRRLFDNIVSKDHILRIERSDFAELGEDIVATCVYIR